MSVKTIIKNDLAKPGKVLALKQVIFSSVFVLCSTVITCFFSGVNQGVSVLLGGVVVIIPNIFFAVKAFKYAGATSSKLVVESLFSGVKIKMVLTAILFALALKFLVIAPVPFLVMFCIATVLPLLQHLLKIR